MSFEVYTYFEIILAGFVTVWTFRKFSKSQAKISDFEYLGCSSFWGLALFFIFILAYKDYPNLDATLANPFATGLFISIFGIIFGAIIGAVSRKLMNKIKNRLLSK